MRAHFLLCTLLGLGLLLNLPGQAAAVEIHLLNGESLVKDSLQFDHKAIARENQDGLPWSDVDRLVFARAKSENTDSPAENTPSLLLKDGSWIPLIKASALDNGLLAQTPLGELTLPFGALVAWGPAPWIEVQRLKNHDVLRVAGNDISGSIQGLRDGRIAIKTDLSPDALTFDLDTVEAAHLAIPVERPRGVYLAAQLSQFTPPALLVPSDRQFVLQAQPKQIIDQQFLRQLVVHGGRRVHLSQLTPSAVNEEGAFGVVWNYATNRNIDGSPLRLGGIRYQSGLVIHSKASLSWELKGAYVAFQAMVGISDLMGEEGDCEVRIIGDDKVLWQQSSVRGGEAPQRVQLDLSGVQTLTVIVDYGARYDIGDHLALADAWLLKAR